jgi:hypothetical protein
MNERHKTSIQKRLFLEQISEIPVVSVVCQKTGIIRSTYYRWIEKDSRFKEKCQRLLDRGTDNINDLAESVVIQKMKDGYLPAARYWLSNRNPKFVSNKLIANEITKDKLDTINKIKFEIFDGKSITENKRLKKQLKEEKDKNKELKVENTKLKLK